MYLQSDAKVGSEVSYLGAHRERSTSLFWLEESWISNSEPVIHKFETSTRKRGLQFEHASPSHCPKNISERPLLKYQTLDKEGLLRLVSDTDSSNEGTFGSWALLQRGLEASNQVSPKCQEMLDSKQR